MLSLLVGVNNFFLGVGLVMVDLVLIFGAVFWLIAQRIGLIFFVVTDQCYDFVGDRVVVGGVDMLTSLLITCGLFRYMVDIVGYFYILFIGLFIIDGLMIFCDKGGLGRGDYRGEGNGGLESNIKSIRLHEWFNKSIYREVGYNEYRVGGE